MAIRPFDYSALAAAADEINFKGFGQYPVCCPYYCLGLYYKGRSQKEVGECEFTLRQEVLEICAIQPKIPYIPATMLKSIVK